MTFVKTLSSRDSGGPGKQGTVKIVTGAEMRLITLKSIFTDIITLPAPDLDLNKKISSAQPLFSANKSTQSGWVG